MAVRRRLFGRRRAPTTIVKSTTTRTSTSRRGLGTGALVLGALGVGALAYLFWPRTARAATTPVFLPMGTPGAPGAPGLPGAPGGGAQVTVNVPPGAAVPTMVPASTAAPGTVSPRPGTQRVQVVAPSGLNVRAQPTQSSARLGGAAFQTQANLVAPAPNGWAQIEVVNSDNGQVITGFVCSTCAAAPGGPWLVPTGANV